MTNRTTAESDGRPKTDPPEESPAKAILSLGLPLVVGAVATLLSGLVDMAMIGRYGASELAAVAGAVAVFDIFAAVLLASLMGHQILAARFAGKDEPAGIRRSAIASIRFGGTVALVSAALCAFAGGPLTELVAGRDPELRAVAGEYLLATAPYLLLLVPYALITTTFNAYRRPQMAMYGAYIMMGSNLLFDWLLIFGPGPFPRLGAAGCGLATTLSIAIGLGFMVLGAKRFEPFRRLRHPGPVAKVDFSTSIPGLAWPAMVSQAVDYASVAVFFAIVATIGSDALAGGRIGFQLMVIVFGLLTAFAVGGRILIGRAVGAEDVDRARTLWRVGARTLLLVATPLCLAMVFAPQAIAAAITSFEGVRESAAEAIVMVGLCLPLMAWTLGAVATLRALGKTKSDMYANLIAAVAVQLPVSWLFAEAAGLGVRGAFLGLVGYWIARGLYSEFAAHRALRDEARRVEA